MGSRREWGGKMRSGESIKGDGTERGEKERARYGGGRGGAGRGGRGGRAGEGGVRKRWKEGKGEWQAEGGVARQGKGHTKGRGKGKGGGEPG